MDDNKWAEAYSLLMRGLEAAFAAGFTEEEIQDAIDNCRPDEEPHTHGKKKPGR